MLKGLEGGVQARSCSRSVGEALEAYAESRTERIDSDELVAVEMALEVVAAFFHQENADLIPGIPRRLPEPARDSSLVHVLDESFLLRGLFSCVHLFPHYCVVSAGLIEFFAKEVRKLMVWSREQGIASKAECDLFDKAWPEASAPLSNLKRLQAALEISRVRYGLQPGEELVQGRFQVRMIRGGALEVVVPDTDSRYRLRLPREALTFFQQGHEVSMVLEKRALGWIALASSLPISTEALAALQDHARSGMRSACPTPV